MNLKKPIFFTYDLERKRGVDLIAVIHVDDRSTEVLEVALTQDGEPVSMTGKTVTARFVSSKTRILFSDNVACSVNAKGNILIPFDNAVIRSRKCDLKIEVNITDGDEELTLQFPLWVRVNGSILDNAEITPESQGIIPELLEEVRLELARVKDFISSDDVYEIIDLTLSGNPNTYPTLLIDNNNQAGDYILYYYDSDEVRHDIFNFSQHFAEGQGADGKSAYEIAVEHGFVGTEAQWLTSLIGATGAQGAKGDKGDKGDTGAAGADWVPTSAEKTAIAAEAAGMISVPTKTSDLTNDSGFLTQHQSLANYYNKTEVNNLLNGKANSSHTHSQYLTLNDLPIYNGGVQ